MPELRDASRRLTEQCPETVPSLWRSPSQRPQFRFLRRSFAEEVTDEKHSKDEHHENDNRDRQQDKQRIFLSKDLNSRDRRRSKHKDTTNQNRLRLHIRHTPARNSTL